VTRASCTQRTCSPVGRALRERVLTLVVFIAGIAASLAASAVLVTRLERLGERLGAPEAMLGLITALAADSPEISAAVAALARGQRDVGVGVVLGSNVFNLAALLGLSALISGRIVLHRRVVILEGVVALWVAAASIATIARIVTPAQGLGLTLAAFIPYVVVSALPPAERHRFPLPRPWRAWLASAVNDEELELLAAIHPRKGSWPDVAAALVALTVVVVASTAMEWSASVLGVRYGVSSIVVGGLILAAVTSLPNAVAAIYLASRGRASATLSEAFNSNALNTIIGLMIPAVVLGMGRPSEGGVVTAGWYAGLTAITVCVAYAGRGVSRRAGILIIAVYLIFAIVLSVT
jgi:cation:H+ antiporter